MVRGQCLGPIQLNWDDAAVEVVACRPWDMGGLLGGSPELVGSNPNYKQSESSCNGGNKNNTLTILGVSKYIYHKW